MLTLLIIGLILLSLVIGKSSARVAGILDFTVALLILFFMVIPGRADVLDWIFMVLFFIGGAVFCFGGKEILA